MLRVIKSNFLNYFRLFNSGIGSVLSSFIKKKYLFYSFLLLLFFTIYVLILNQIKNYAELKQNNFNTFLKSNEFNNIKNYIFKNLNSPYQEFTYTVQNNDTIDKVLRKFDVDVNDIKNITAQIANKKLSNIFINTEIRIITKEDQGINKLVSFFYPIDEITSVEVKRNKDEFVINKNILKLEKKEVVLSNSIKNNLYSSAIEVGVEPNIIVEFANIFGFEVDFQRDIQVGDKFEIYYERLLDEDGVVRNTGKIFYASMFVNNKEISLYNFKYNNDDNCLLSCKSFCFWN